MDNKGIVQNDIADAQDKVQKPQQNLKDEIKNLNKDIVKFTELKNIFEKQNIRRSNYNKREEQRLKT